MSKIIDQIRFTLTSIGLAAALAASPCSIGSAASAESGNAYSYDISYLDESQAAIDDNYDEELMEKYRNAPDDMIVEIPRGYRVDLSVNLDKEKYDDEVTVGDLRSIKTIFLSTRGYEDPSFLNYCSDLGSLYVDGNFSDSASNIMGFENLKEITFSSGPLDVVDLDECGFLFHCPNLENVTILGYYNPEQVYDLVNVKHLTLDVRTIHKIDYKKLAFLEELTIIGGEYDIAIYMTNDVIDYLEKNGVKLTLNPYGNTGIDDVREINDRLDEIVKSLNISDQATDEEKIQAVLIYVLSNSEYDVSFTRNRIGLNEKEFYKGGELYGALERDTQIHGNYSSFISSLLNRIGIDDYQIKSNGTSWNQVRIGDDYYYFNAALLDKQLIIYDGNLLNPEDVIRSGNQELIGNLLGYKLNPDDYNNYVNNSSEADEINKAPYIIIEATKNNDDNINSNGQSKQGDNDFAHKLFDVTIGNNVFRITGAVLIGIMSAFGLAFRKGKIEERKRKKDLDYILHGYDDSNTKGDSSDSRGHSKQ